VSRRWNLFSRNLSTGDDRGIPVAQLRGLTIPDTVSHDARLAGPHTPTDIDNAPTHALLTLDPERDIGWDLGAKPERISGFAAPHSVRVWWGRPRSGQNWVWST
jgi:hypothetical protein